MRFAILLLTMLAALPAEAAHVPFVGCRSDGQQGPQPAPRDGATPDVPAVAAPRLAFYQTPDGVGVLAPRGWQCLGTLGSNGDSIIVAPRPLDWSVVTGKTPLTGPAIQLSISDGGTSGRFEVAAIAARLFPAATAFVDGVEREGMLDMPLVRHPYPADRITRRGAYQALFTTPPGARGLGTASRLAPGPLPIDGIAIYDPKDDVSLTLLAARLSPADRPLVAAIIAAVRARP